MRHPLPYCLAIFLLAPPLFAQSNAESELVIRGDVLGSPISISISGLLPGQATYLIPAFSNSGSNYLTTLSGDTNDMLAVDTGLANGGTLFLGNADGAGRWDFTMRLPSKPGLLDLPLYLQAFNRTSASGANMFQRFSNLLVMTPNSANRWQPLQDAPVASALAGSCVLERTADGDPKTLFISGGGPVLLTDDTNPYSTSDRAWSFDCLQESYTLLGGVMQTSRAFHGAVTLLDGRVMVVGGITGPFQGTTGAYYTSTLNSAEIYDPATDSWTTTPAMSEYRAGATANLLPDGRVLVAGGTKGDSSNNLASVTDIMGTATKTTEIYDPATNSWVLGPKLPEPKAGASSLTLSDGRIMIAGGITHTFIFGIPIPDFSEKITFYNPASNTFESTVNMVSKRALFPLTELADGRVFIPGGAGGDIFNIGPIRKCEVYDPTNGSTTAAPNLSIGCAFSGCVLLPDGRALVVGGGEGTLDDPIPIANCWIYDPASNTLNDSPPLLLEHAGGTVVLTSKSNIVVLGGETGTGVATAASESFSF